MVDAKSFIFVAQRPHENAGLCANKVVSLKEHKPHGRIAVVCITNLPETVVQVTCQRHRQNVRHSIRICSKNLIYRNEEPDGVLEPRARHRFPVQNGLALTIDHLNAGDAANQNMISVLSHLLKRSLKGKSREGGGWKEHGNQNYQ
jgi:hypothetical protein